MLYFLSLFFYKSITQLFIEQKKQKHFALEPDSQELNGIYCDKRTPATRWDRISGITGSMASFEQIKSVNNQASMTHNSKLMYTENK